MYTNIVSKFEKISSLTIAIFRPISTENNKFYSNIYEVLSEKGVVEFVDESFMSSYEGLQKNIVDILIIPELDKVHYLLFKSIKTYIDNGGAVILSAQDFFMPGKVLNEFTQFGNKNHDEDAYYKKTTAFLGIKPYKSDVLPTKASIDTDFISSVDMDLSVSLPIEGGQFNNSSDKLIPSPPVGHVFPERYEVLRNYPIITGVDTLGKKINVPVTFAHNWENKSRLVLYSTNHDGSFLDPNHPYFSTILKSAIEFCENKIMAVSCQPEFACYKQGETPSIFYEILNSHDHAVEFDVEMRISTTDKVYLTKTQSFKANPAQKIHNKIIWNVDNFAEDYYEVSIKVMSKGKILSKVSNGFVVWNEISIMAGPNVKSAGKYFDIDGKSSVITGTNYYESNLGEMMWIKPNISKLNTDFKQMSNNGINYIRIHYHHPKWFQDYMSKVAGDVPEYYKNKEEYYLPDERILRIFDAHIYLSQKYNIIYGGDLFTLLPEELGDPRGWYGTHDYMWFDDKIEKQKEFLDLLIPRYTSVPGIAWDIYNEPHSLLKGDFENKFKSKFNKWAKNTKEYMRKLGDNHLITVGTESPTDYDEVLDFYAEHRNHKYAAQLKTNTSKPEMFQEVWLDRKPSPTGEMEQLSDMRQSLLDTFRIGLAGFSPWQWTNQQRLWADFRTFIGEIWDDQLGCCVRNDGTLKPSGRFYKDFSIILQNSTFLTFNQGVIKSGNGNIMFNAAENVEIGDYFFLETSNDDENLKGIARKKVEIGNLKIESDSDNEIWYDYSNKDILYFKTDQKCNLTISGAKDIKTTYICDKPHGQNHIKYNPIYSNDNIIIKVKNWYINYWLCAKFLD